MLYLQPTPRRLLAPVAAILLLSACANDTSAVKNESTASDQAIIEEILQTLDQTTLPAETLADLYLDDAVILQPGAAEVRGRNEIIALMEQQASGPALDMRHRADEISTFDDIIVVQGGVRGEARPDDGSGPFPFATKNLILFKRDANGRPKIWKVIFNAAPDEAPTD